MLFVSIPMVFHPLCLCEVDDDSLLSSLSVKDLSPSATPPPPINSSWFFLQHFSWGFMHQQGILMEHNQLIPQLLCIYLSLIIIGKVLIKSFVTFSFPLDLSICYYVHSSFLTIHPFLPFGR